MEQALSILPPITYLAFIAIEKLFPAQSLTPVRRWRLKGLLFFALGGLIVGALPGLWAPFARAHRLVDLEHLGTPLGFFVALVVGDLLGWLYHRVRHAVTPLWRIHQMHHSAERLDLAGAFYFHPLDSLGFAFVSTFLASFVVGVTPLAAALVGYFGFFMAVFTHANLRTPHWLGYLVQRPESHAIHHERGVHAFNYGDLALWDLVFGTFRNPAAAPRQVGFWDGASARVGAMLVGIDVSQPPEEGVRLAERATAG